MLLDSYFSTKVEKFDIRFNNQRSRLMVITKPYFIEITFNSVQIYNLVKSYLLQPINI